MILTILMILRIIINCIDLFTGIKSNLLTAELFLNNVDSDKAKQSFTKCIALRVWRFWIAS